MSIEPDFNSVSEADAAYYSSGSAGSTAGGGGGGRSNGGSSQSGNETTETRSGDDSAQWSELQTLETDWEGGWNLAYQQRVNDRNRRRWFVIRMTQDEQFQALTMTGQVEDIPQDASLEEVPHTDSEDEARRAYKQWAEENVNGEDGSDGSSGSGESGEWSEWQEVSEQYGWVIYGREHSRENRVQFFAGSETDDGTTVYLQPDGTPGQEQHIFDSQEALEQALQEYAQRTENGEVPQDRQPTGRQPNNRPSGQSESAVSGLIEAVGGPRNAAIIGTLAAGGLYYAEREGMIDLAEGIGE